MFTYLAPVPRCFFQQLYSSMWALIVGWIWCIVSTFELKCFNKQFCYCAVVLDSRLFLCALLKYLFLICIDFWDMGFETKNVHFWPYNQNPWWSGPALTLFDGLFIRQTSKHESMIYTQHGKWLQTCLWKIEQNILNSLEVIAFPRGTNFYQVFINFHV